MSCARFKRAAAALRGLDGDQVAAALQAEKLVFLTDTPGLLRNQDDPNSLIHQVNNREIQSLTKDGIISGGMIPKTRCAIDALKGGVTSVHIIDGRVEHAVLLELFTNQGVGTLLLNH